MSCGCNNNGGWGGCGCGNTVQYAPSACNPNFPTTCTALGQGVIQRVVGEDSSYCKYTVPTFQVLPLNTSNTKGSSILTYSGTTAGVVNWGDGSSAAPIYITSPDGTSFGQAYQSPLYGTTGVSLQATTATGQLVELAPTSTYSSKVQIPVVAPSGSTTTWGTIDNIIQNDGVVYRSSGIVAEASLGTVGQVLAINSSGVPAFTTPSTPAFIDARSVYISYASTTSLTVNFGQLVVNNPGNSGNPSIVINNSATYTLTFSNTGIANGLDSGSISSSTFYYVYAIYNPTSQTIATLASANPTTPTLPANYTYYRLIGVVRTSTASATIPTAYSQNGRNVNLGAPANVNITTVTISNVANVYYTGTVSTGISQLYVNRAFVRWDYTLNSGTNAAISSNIYFTNTANGSTGTTVPTFATTNEIYGAMASSSMISESASNQIFNSTNIMIPNSLTTLYYQVCLNTTNVHVGDVFNLQISGYELSFL